MADGSIIIDTLLDPHGLEQGLGSVDKIASKGLKIFTGAVVAAGTALGGLGLAGIKLASDLEEVQNVVDVTFGDNAGIINDWAKAAKNAFGMSELDAKKFNGTMGAMLKSMGLNSEEVLNMSSNMVGLAGDFASFYNLGHEEAFDKIRAGISGETEPLKQLGINMSVANLEAYALAQGIQTAYKDMSQAEQATLRYNYLLSASADAQGDFARTSDSLANQLRIAKLNMQELGSEIGQMLMPVAQEAVTKFNELGGQLRESLSSPEMQESIQKIAEALGDLIEKIAEVISEWIPKIIEGFAWMVENADIIAAGIIGIGTAMLTLNVANMILGVVKAFQAAKKAEEGLTVAQWLLNVAMAANPIGIIIALIVGLIAAVVYLWNTNEGFRDAVIACWNAIKDAAVAVWEWIVNFFTVDIPNAWNTLMEFFKGIPDWFGELWGKVTDKFREWGTNISNFFTETIPTLISNVANWFGELPYKIGYKLGETFATVFKWGQDTGEYLRTNVPIWIDNVVTFFSQLPGRIATWLKETINKIVSWGSEMYRNAVKAGKDFIDGVINWIKELPGRIATWLSDTISRIINFASDVGAKAREAGSNIVSGIVDTITDLPSKVYEIGTNIVQGLWNGITSMGGWIKDKVGSFFSGIVDGAKSVLGINSPSRVFRDQVGRYMAQGVGVGFENESDTIEKDIENSLSNLTAKMNATVSYERSKNIPASVSGKTSESKTFINNNENGVTQNITFNQPVKSPAETAREIRRVGRELAW